MEELKLTILLPVLNEEQTFPIGDILKNENYTNFKLHILTNPLSGDIKIPERGFKVEKVEFDIHGMTSSSCSAHGERAVTKENMSN